ncbi:hypothetical protein D1872_171500 [compost metagenome]
MPDMYTLKWGAGRNGKKRYKPDPERFIFNVDTLWYTYDSDNYDEVMQSGLMSRLVNGKSVAEDGEGTDYIEVKLHRYEYPVTFSIESGGQAPIYAFQIRNADMAIYFARRRRNDGTYPVKVQINQFKLWELGAQDAFLESLEVLTALGFVYEAAKPNRIDLCVHSDQYKWTLDDLKTLDYPRNVADDNKPNFIKLDPMTGEFETVYYGDRSRLQLRLYNKSLEIDKKKKDYFKKIYEDKGMDSGKVWNVEFEVHRDYLKNFACEETGETGIFDTMDFLLRLDGLSLLWTHLTQKFTHGSAFWKLVQQGDPNRFVECKNHIFRLKDIDTTKIREIAQIRGRLQKLVLNEDLPDGADFMNEAIKIFISMVHDYEDQNERDFVQDVYQNRRAYMDTEMLKLRMAERKQSTDPSILLNELLKKKRLHNVDRLLIKKEAQ